MKRYPGGWGVGGALTVLVGAEALRRAARAVSRGREAQHRCVVVGELFQARYVTDVDAVLEVGTHCDHADLAGVTGFPRQELETHEESDLTGGVDMPLTTRGHQRTERGCYTLYPWLMPLMNWGLGALQVKRTVVELTASACTFPGGTVGTGGKNKENRGLSLRMF